MTDPAFAVCLSNEGFAASLEVRKLYPVLPDSEAARHRQIRVIDESGEDDLYPAEMFEMIALSEPLRWRLLSAA